MQDSDEAADNNFQNSFRWWSKNLWFKCLLTKKQWFFERIRFNDRGLSVFCIIWIYVTFFARFFHIQCGNVQVKIGQRFLDRIGRLFSFVNFHFVPSKKWWLMEVLNWILFYFLIELSIGTEQSYHAKIYDLHHSFIFILFYRGFKNWLP